MKQKLWNAPDLEGHTRTLKWACKLQRAWALQRAGALHGGLEFAAGAENVPGKAGYPFYIQMKFDTILKVSTSIVSLNDNCICLFLLVFCF